MRSRGVQCNVHTYSALMNVCIKGAPPCPRRPPSLACALSPPARALASGELGQEREGRRTQRGSPAATPRCRQRAGSGTGCVPPDARRGVHPQLGERPSRNPASPVGHNDRPGRPSLCAGSSPLPVDAPARSIMSSLSLLPSQVTMNTLIDVYGKTGAWEEAIRWGPCRPAAAGAPLYCHACACQAWAGHCFLQCLLTLPTSCSPQGVGCSRAAGHRPRNPHLQHG